MKNLQSCLVYFVGGVILAVAITGAVYVHEMSPTWNDIARRQAEFDMQIAKANAMTDIQAHEQRSMAINAGSWVLVVLLFGVGAVLLWKEYDKRQESWARPVDGQFAIQTFDNGKVIWKVDINKSFPGNAGFERSTGLLGERSSGAQEGKQLTYNLAVQKTRTVTAASSQPIKYAAHAKMLAGGYDKEPKQLTATEALDDGDAMPDDWQPLTLQDALEQSTDDSWVLGQNSETGELYRLDIRDVVHLGIVGATGTGKTMYIGLLMMANAIRSKWRIVVFDGKGGADWSKFSGLIEYYTLDYVNVGRLLGQMVKEYERRQAKLNEAGANSIWDLTPMPRPTMVLIDEFGSVMDSLKIANPTEYKKVSLELGNMLRLSRSTGISMVFCDQDPSKWPSAMRANLPVNICFKLGGMKGNSIAEYNLNELDRKGHFQVDGERYHAWPTYQMIDSLLPSDYRKPKALLSENMSVDDDGGEGQPVLTDKRTDGQTSGQADITALQLAVLKWRRDNPDGLQADCIRAMAENGLKLSRQYASDLWKLQV